MQLLSMYFQIKSNRFSSIPADAEELLFFFSDTETEEELVRENKQKLNWYFHLSHETSSFMKGCLLVVRDPKVPTWSSVIYLSVQQV